MRIAHENADIAIGAYVTTTLLYNVNKLQMGEGKRWRDSTGMSFQRLF
ncbi:MAG: hypothetical protein KC435_13255 [Thermomicrobiales bacterium]|nr:hypothetical protein [Thermomicrobiales bacterium]